MDQLMWRSLNGRVSWTSWVSLLFNSEIKDMMLSFIWLLLLMELKSFMMVLPMKLGMRPSKKLDKKTLNLEKLTWLIQNGTSLTIQ